MTTTVQVRSWQTDDGLAYEALESWTSTPNSDGTTTVEVRDPRLCRQAIPMKLSTDGRRIVATVPGSKISTTGESEVEAIENLKCVLEFNHLLGRFRQTIL